MIIRISILSGEILTLLENASCSIRINDIETILQISKIEAKLAIVKLLSEELIVLIREDERSAIALNNRAVIRKNDYLERNMSNFLVPVKQKQKGERNHVEYSQK